MSTRVIEDVVEGSLDKGLLACESLHAEVV